MAALSHLDNNVPPNSHRFTTHERSAVAGLAAIYATRLLGLFLILPVFALYAEGLTGYTPALAGLALGIYGLTQACLQLPLGMASDRFGRKLVIVAGLVVFAVGSVVAALATSIEGVLIGRALQGVGAVNAAVMALVADVTRDVVRSRAMAVIGITIGASFVASLLLGPILNGLVGVPGIFWITCALAVSAIVIILVAVPLPTEASTHQAVEVESGKFLAVLAEPRLLALNAGIFILHLVLVAVFVVIPGALVRSAGLPLPGHWKIYVPIMVLSGVLLFPLLSAAERRHRTGALFAGCIAVLAISQAVLACDHESLAGIAGGLLMFFLAFNVLEASLPARISLVAPPGARGAAIGIYNTFQFLGAFAGGAIGGWLHGRFGATAVFILGTAVTVVWLAIAWWAPPVSLSAAAALPEQGK